MFNHSYQLDNAPQSLIVSTVKIDVIDIEWTIDTIDSNKVMLSEGTHLGETTFRSNFKLLTLDVSWFYNKLQSNKEYLIERIKKGSLYTLLIATSTFFSLISSCN